MSINSIFQTSSPNKGAIWDVLNLTWSQINSGQQPVGPLYQKLDEIYQLNPELYGEWLNAHCSSTKSDDNDQDLVRQQNSVIRNKLDFIWSQIQYAQQQQQLEKPVLEIQSYHTRITDDLSPEFTNKEEIDLLYDQLHEMSISNPDAYSEWFHVPNYSNEVREESAMTNQGDSVSKDLWNKLDFIWRQINECRQQPDSTLYDEFDTKEEHLKRLQQQLNEINLQIKPTNHDLYSKWLDTQIALTATSRVDSDNEEQIKTCEAPPRLPARVIGFVWQCVTSSASLLYDGVGLLKSKVPTVFPPNRYY